MGYSVTAPCKSAELQQEMLAFLGRHWQTWEELGAKSGGEISRPKGTALSYDSGRSRIGFDSKAFGGECEYAIAVVRWIALKIGRRTPIARLPYYVYDGTDAIPIFTKGPTPKGSPNLVDKWGVPVPDKANKTSSGVWRVQALLEAEDDPDALKRIRTELRRLDALWNTSRKDIELSV